MAANTTDPGPASTGIDSPVIAAWSTVACPSMTSPSTGICSPGRTTTVSPTRTSPTGTSDSIPPRTTRAVRGAIAVRSRTARRARSVVNRSTESPTRMKSTTTAAVAHCPMASAEATPSVINVWAMIRRRSAARSTFRKTG